jgi:hypothetical protein
VHNPGQTESANVISQTKDRDRCNETVGILFASKPRLMSDYEVNLVNDNMQEFYVKFHGPTDSKEFVKGL